MEGRRRRSRRRRSRGRLLHMELGLSRNARLCLAGKRMPMPARNDPSVPFRARFFKNARACPRPANPHSQALYKSSTVRPLPPSAQLLQCFALLIAKPPSKLCDDSGKRVRRPHHPTLSTLRPVSLPPPPFSHCGTSLSCTWPV